MSSLPKFVTDISNRDAAPLRLFKLCYLTIFLLISIRSIASKCKILQRVPSLINSYIKFYLHREQCYFYRIPSPFVSLLTVSHKLSISNEKSPSWEANICSPVQDILHCLWDPKFHSCVDASRQWILSWAVLILIIFKFNSKYYGLIRGSYRRT
jgi:hypothetical protein